MITEGIFAEHSERTAVRRHPQSPPAAVVQMALSRFGPLRFALQVFPPLPLPCDDEVPARSSRGSRGVPGSQVAETARCRRLFIDEHLRNQL